MTLYLRVRGFEEGPSQLRIGQGDIYILKVLVEGIERKIYKIKGQNIRHFTLDEGESFIGLALSEYLIEIKLYLSDQYNVLNELCSLQLRKQQLKNQKQLEKKQNNEIIECQFQLQPIALDRTKVSNNEQIANKVKMEIKFDKYKKILGGAVKNPDFLSQLTGLQEQRVSASRIPSSYHRSIGQFYLGPCSTKNAFSCIDPPVSDQEYTIVEHSYE